MAKMGRPLKLDLDDPNTRRLFESYCHIHCTEVEICALLEVDRVTLHRACKRYYKATFEQVFKEKSSNGKMSLRRRMYQVALPLSPNLF
jgi:hypothetical protein